jgi:outer membrane receptor for ferrienterochelin and colicin
MRKKFPRNKCYRLSSAIATATLLSTQAGSILAQDSQNIEEVMVTGSYIRNSAFAQDSNVSTVTQADLFDSGAPSMGQYIRDLTYTQNIDTVANVNAGQDGGQDASNATFNLRGLGENSTLTLADGVRSINNALQTLIPDIAVERLEIVLDGGSALYGSDAVAGVVNLIPIKDFDGFRARTYYQRDADPDFEESKISLLWGRSFDNGINYVGAFDAAKIGSLMTFERPEILEYDYGYSSSGNPGVYRQVEGATPNVGGVHGGTVITPSLRDPSCGTFAQSPEETYLGAAKNNPSGLPVGDSGCFMTYSPQWPLMGEQTTYNLYNNMTWDAANWLQFELSMNHAWHEVESRNTGTYGQNTNNRNALLIPADHPANPYGFDVVPQNYRPFTYLDEERWPSHFEQSTGARKQPISYYTQRYKLGAQYELGNSWNGYTYYSKQYYMVDRDEKLLHIGKMQQALLGMGGPNGDQYWNPFGSADPRSPFFDEPTTRNSQELVDWLFTNVDNVPSNEDELDIFETTIAGELFELPYGMLQMATGFQMRDRSEGIFQNPLELMSMDYNVNIVDTPPRNDTFVSKVYAAFVEFDVPITDTLAAQVAVRHERFEDFGLDATTPKVALRWEALPELALRASWGESFLAPTASQARPFDPNEGCGEIFFGADPLTGGQLTGGASCSSGNPALQPETSVMTNFGFTYEPTGMLDGLSVSLDYQQIEYTDRIRTLSTPDTADKQFQDMLNATGISEADYDPTPGSATRTAANAWLRTQDQSGASGVIRDPNDQSVLRVIRQANNISSVWIDLFDAKVDYTFNTDNRGTFAPSMNVTYYETYEYEDLFGGIQNALGQQNANSGVVPPLPGLKVTAKLSWFMDAHSASLTANFTDEVRFDDNTNALFTGFTAPDTIDSQTIVNGQYAYQFDNLFNSTVMISGGIRNIFDEMPQRLPILGGFESRLQQPWGRQFWLSLDWTPGA